MINDTLVQIVHGDITLEATDIIVNAANTKLAHGGGIAAAIVSRGGIEVQNQSTEYVKTHGDVTPGDVVVTDPGHLKCKQIYHAVAPIYEKGENKEDEIIRSLLLKIYTMVEEGGHTSFAMPSVGTGILNYPKEYFAIMLFDTIYQYFAENPQSKLKEIRLTNVDIPSVTYLSREFLKRFATYGDKLDLRLDIKRSVSSF